MSLHRLIPLFDRARRSDEPLVLATVIRTGGSTYAKPGAQMLIASDGEYAGLLSGGCLEGDLREHARDGGGHRARRASSATTCAAQDDQLFGLGAGCEGAMDILLTRAWTGRRRLAAAGLHGAGASRRLRPAPGVRHRHGAMPGSPLGCGFPADGETPRIGARRSRCCALLQCRGARDRRQRAQPRRRSSTSNCSSPASRRRRACCC